MVMASTFLFASMLALAAPPKARPAQAAANKKPEPPRGNAVLGQEKADSERCIECHGADGQGAGHPNGAEGKFAKLAGQQPAYVLKQIRDFRSGARKHDQMAIMARSVSDEDILDIAAFFAGLPPMKGDGTAKGDAVAAARALYEQGDAARGIVACASCHGPKGEGVTALPNMPLIGGQEWRYLDKQLREWRSGERRNDPDGTMNRVTRGLSDNEIEALATYLSGI